MATKKVTKKNLTKFPDTRAPKKKPAKDDGVYWVLSERKFLTWKPVMVFKTFDAATTERRNREDNGSLATSYKVDRVVMG